MGDHYRASTGDLGRSERWDRDRFVLERDRDERVRFEENDRYYRRDSGARGPPAHYRESSVDARIERRRVDDDDYVVRDRRYYYDDEPRSARLPHRPSPPGSAEYDRRVVIEKERVRSPSPGPRQRPGLLRRQSSLDTFDRQPRFFARREEYGPPARREDFRPPPNVPIPLPRERGLPPPRRYDDREYYEEIRVSEPDHYGDEDFRPVPERIREREKEVVRTRRRAHSRESRSTRRSHHGASTIRSSSRSSSTTSSSSSSSATTTLTVKSEYPKKGKTRIPARLVSERALIDLGYPFIKEGNTIVVQKALGQENIDDLLKLSEDYKKSDVELITGRSEAPREVIEERREEFFMTPAVHPGPPPPPPIMHAPPPAPPTVVYAQPPPPPPPAPVEIVDKTTVIRDVSPARSYTTTTTSTSRTPVVIDARERVEISEPVPVGPLALVTADSHRRHRSHSRGSRDIRSEISHLERELARRERRHGGGELVTAERLSNGELVLYEEQVVKVEEPRKGVRIEKDKKGPPPGLVRAMLATLT